MEDVLLELHAAAPHETITTPAYHWNNRVRRGGGLILQYTFTGEGLLRRGRHASRCGPGQALIMAEGDRTEYFFPPEARQPWTFCWINFTGAGLLWRHWIKRHGDIVTLDPEGEACGILRQITRLYHRKAFHDRYHASDLLGRLLCAMGREFAGVAAAPPAQRAAEILRDHHRRPLNIKEVATQMGLSREHFTRLFTREHQQSPATVLRELRLATARRLLRQTRMPITEVAEQSGFASAVHFCRAFKARHSSTPLTYRQQSSARP